MIQHFNSQAGSYYGWYRDDDGDLIYFPAPTALSYEYILFLAVSVELEGYSASMVVYDDVGTASSSRKVITIPSGMSEEELCAWAIATWRMQ